MASSKAHSPSAYSILLLQKLLNLRDGISPFTLVLDSLQAPGIVIVEEFMLRAKLAGTKVLFVSSFIVGGRRRSPHIDILVERKRKSLDALRSEILAHVQPGPSSQRFLIVIDSLCQMALQDPQLVGAFAASLVSPAASVVGLFHLDVAGSAGTGSSGTATAAGKPAPFQVLCSLATALLTVHALHQEVAKKRARDRCEEEPQFGLDETGAGRGNGWLAGSRKQARALLGEAYEHGRALDMELRRRSGRAVVERFVLVYPVAAPAAAAQESPALAAPSQPPLRRPRLPWHDGAMPCSNITVMADHPLFAVPRGIVKVGNTTRSSNRTNDDDDDDDDNTPLSTFDLGLTEKQRRDRDGVVLPYFDAQTDIGGGEGGRILYEMGREDDFDDEEDEI